MKTTKAATGFAAARIRQVSGQSFLPQPPAKRSRPSTVDIVLPILIGLTTLSGALLAWQASSLESEASDVDRRAVLEAAKVEGVKSHAEDLLQDGRSAYLRYIGEKSTEEELLKSAEQARARGDAATAKELADEAREAGDLARFLQDTTSFYGYDTIDSGDAAAKERLRAGLVRNLEAKPPDPARSAKEADRLHRASDGTVAWIVALAVAVLLLTAGEFVQRTRTRVELAVTGGVILALATLGGVLAGRVAS